MKKILISVLLLTAVLAGVAQNKISAVMKGKLSDTLTKESLSSATISVLNPEDSSVISYTLSNGKGEFELKNLDTGRFRLVISYQGFTSINRMISITAQKPLTDLGTIYMSKKNTMLDEVIVEAAPITVKKDTVEFRASAFKTVPNSTAEDLLKKLPGVEVDKDGNVKAQGEDIQKVYVDGKEFFANDPKLATKNITSDMIESIQVYDDMSDQAKFTRIDDGSRSKTINIKLKKDKRKGYFGRAIAGYGTDDRYMASLTFNKFTDTRRISIVSGSNNINKQTFNFSDIVGNMGGYGGARGAGGGGGGGGFRGGGGGGITSGTGSGPTGINRSTSVGINYTDKIGSKIDVTGSYFYSETQAQASGSSLRQTFFPKDSVTYQSEQTQSLNTNQNHRFNLRVEYYIDSMNSILYTPSLTFQKSSSSSYDSSSSRTTQPGIDYLALSGVSRNTNQRNGTNLNNNFLYRRKFHKLGRTLTLGWNNSINNSDGDGTNLYPLTFYNPNGYVDSIRDQNFQSSQQTRSHNNVVSASYTEPLGKNKILEFNYAYTDNFSTSDRQAYNYNTGTKLFDSLNAQQTNYFENDFIANRLGFNFRLQNTKYGLQLGGAMQSSDIKNKSIRAIYRVNGKDSVIQYEQTSTNFFPTANFNYNFSRSSNLRIFYRGRTNQPSVTQLQDVRDETNSLQTVVGNPSLKQEFSNTVTASYNSFNPSSFKYINANLNYSQTSNKIVNSIGLDTLRGKGVQLIRPVNLSGSFNAGSSVTLGIPLRKLKGSSLNFSNFLNYNRDVSLLYSQKNTTNTMSVRQKVGINMDIFNQKLNFGLNASLAYNNVRYNNSQNGTQSQKVIQNQNSDYFTQTYSTDVNYFLPLNFVLSTNFDYIVNTGLAAGFNQSVPLWNGSLAKQVFAKKNGEIKFSVNDILNQNRSITRTVTDNYIIDTRAIVLRRYFMLTLTYNLNRAGANNNRPQRGQPGQPRGMDGGGNFNRGGGGFSRDRGQD